MSNTSFTNPGTEAVDTSVGTVNWNSSTNAMSMDTLYDSVSGLSSTYTYYLKLTNFGFSIPSGSTINGIIVRINGYRAVSTACPFANVRIVKGGSISSTNMAGSATLTTSPADYDFGSSSSLWGETWTYSDINSSTFGVVFNLQMQNTKLFSAYIDGVQIQIHYTESSGGTVTSQRNRIAWFF